MKRYFEDLPDMQPGQVWLVGAGPGDPGLLSLLAVHALEQADVIIYDALVNARILDLARPDCTLHYAGKRGGKASANQRDISETLVSYASQNLRVLRLKGGDPFVFGRGGEEALFLVSRGISFRIVPGITAGIGGLAYAGIPATHRTINHGVTFLTGHDIHGNPPDEVDWKHLAHSSGVLVFYMAMKHWAQISQSLIHGGRDASEPVAVITDATLPNQKVLKTNLRDSAQAIENAKLKPPALIVVGKSVDLSAQLAWFKTQGGQ